ncbi:MAG TPA: thioredoxin domain-containing protein [Conexibacter sp.]|jgi:protein-disulfide isomerase
MADTSGTRRDRRAAARQERQERERAAAARARQRTRLFQLGGAVALAAVIVIVILVATGGGDSGPKKQAGETVAGQNATAALFDGIPQNGMTLGDPNAPVTMVEFGDLQCPFCKETSDSVLPDIIRNYVRSGRVKLVFRDVAFIGTDSIRAGQMGGAVAAQNKFWNFMHLFYANQKEENTGYVTDDFLREIAGGVAGVNVATALRERGNAAYQRDMSEAQREWQGTYGFQGTPAFVVGRTGSRLTPVNTDNGAGYDVLSGALDRALGS